MRSSLRAALTFLWILALGPMALAQQPTVRVDNVDVSGFRERGVLQFFVDVLDTRERVVESIQPDDVKFFVNNKPEPGKISITNLRAIGKGTAVMIVLPVYARFSGGDIGKKAVERMISGAKALIEQMEPQDRVSIVIYDEEGYKTKLPFGNGFDDAREMLDELGQSIEHGEATAEAELPRLLERLLPAMIRNGFKGDLPERQLILVVTAGQDRLAESGNEGRIAKKLDDLVSLAKDATYGPPKKVFVIGVEGFTDREKLGPFRRLASQTSGGYVGVKPSKEFDELTDSLREIGERILKQWVITWTPEDWRGGKGTVRVEIAVKGTPAHCDVEQKWPKKPFPWLKWVGIVLGSLFGVFLLVMIIRAIARRPRRVVQQAPEQQATPGAARAMLRITAGPHAGDEIYLEAEVTTFGKSDACDFAFRDGKMSRRHCAIRIEDMRFELSDLKSTNGTFVNGQRVEKCFLKDGDHILMGTSELTFKLLR